MSDNCQLVVFSNKAYNAIIRESFDKDPVETGGILLGHVLDNGVWIVMEVLPPGINSIFQYAYFEYDEAFVNYLAQSVANQYKRPLDLLGLWHRHPGGMDVFSTTDDGTNLTFARQNPAGVISGLVNIDPRFRLTMYHLDCPIHRPMGRPDYSVVEVEVGDDIIPEEYFELRYFDGNEANLHPMVSQRTRNFQPRQVIADQEGRISSEDMGLGTEQVGDDIDIQRIMSGQLPPCTNRGSVTTQVVDNFFPFWRDSKMKWLYVLLALVALILTVCTFRSCKVGLEKLFDDEKSEVVTDHIDSKAPSLSVDEITITEQGASKTIKIINSDKKATWKSSNPKVAIVKDGKVTAIANGTTVISAFIDKEKIGQCNVVVEIDNPTDPEGNTDVVSEDVTSATTATEVESAVNALIDTNKTYQHGKVGSIKIGEKFPVPIKKTGNPTVTFTLSNPDIATIKNGEVIATKTGTTIISVLCNGTETDAFTLHINEK